MKMFTFRRGWVAMCLTLVSVVAAAAERCTLSGLEIPVTMIGTRAVAMVGINGEQIPLMIDSGAFFSFLNPAAAKQLRLKRRELPFGMRIEGLTGEVEAYMAVVDKVQLPGGAIPDVEFVVGGNEGGSGTMGLLGRNFLSMADTEYDLAHGMIRLIFPRGDCKEDQYAYWAGQQPVVELPLLRDTSDPKRPALRATALANDYPLRVLLDTGASSGLSLTAALKAGITREQMVAAGKMYGAGKGSADAWTAPLQRFAIGGEEVRDIRMRVAEFEKGDYDMLLGIDFFLAHRIYISKSLRRMYFTHNGGPVFALSAAERPGGDAAPEDPSFDAAAYLRRGAASAARKNYAAALTDFDRACAMAPDQAEPLVRRGILHMTLKQGQQARLDMDAALKIEPKNTEALLMRAQLRKPTERDAALVDLQTLDHTLAPQAQMRQTMAWIYDRWEQPREALAQWSQWIPAHETDAGRPNALNSRCWLRMRLATELDAARADCDEAIAAESKNAAFHDTRGWLRLRRGELQEALSDFDAAIKLQPDQALSLYGRGVVRERLGEPAQADLEAARKLHPKIDVEAKKQGLPIPG